MLLFSVAGIARFGIMILRITVNIKMSEILFMVLLAVLIVVGGFWLLGRNQPVITVARNAGNTTALKCPKCSGLGYAESQQRCQKCRGSGKVEPFSKSSSSKGFAGSKLMCVNCRGTGKAAARVSCEACAGKGSLQTAARVMTVRAGLSLWERCLARLGIKPDPDCAPQMINGKFPLVEQYLLLEGNRRKLSVESYTGLERVDGKWHINAVLRSPGSDSPQPATFVVHNRAVAGVIPGR